VNGCWKTLGLVTQSAANCQSHIHTQLTSSLGTLPAVLSRRCEGAVVAAAVLMGYSQTLLPARQLLQVVSGPLLSHLVLLRRQRAQATWERMRTAAVVVEASRAGCCRAAGACSGDVEASTVEGEGCIRGDWCSEGEGVGCWGRCWCWCWCCGCWRC
jgi:hypothetical protein